jgi:hypothetical protein
MRQTRGRGKQEEENSKKLRRIKVCGIQERSTARSGRVVAIFLLNINKNMKSYVAS